MNDNYEVKYTPLDQAKSKMAAMKFVIDATIKTLNSDQKLKIKEALDKQIDKGGHQPDYLDTLIELCELF